MPEVRPNISVQLPADDRAPPPHVPGVESVAREVVMLPAAQDLCGDWVEIVTTVLVAVIVVVVAGEAAHSVVRSLVSEWE